MLMVTRPFIFLVAVLQSSCFNYSGFMKQSTQGERNAIAFVTTVDKEGATTGSVVASLNQTQVLQAEAGSSIAGTTASFKPGTLAFDTEISIAAASTLVASQVGETFGLGSKINVQNKASAVEIKSSVKQNAAVPFTLEIPLPSPSLMLATNNLYETMVVVYEAWDFANNKQITGVIPRSKLSIDSSKGRAVIATHYFGKFQAVLLEQKVEEEAKVEAPLPPEIKDERKEEQTPVTPSAPLALDVSLTSGAPANIQVIPIIVTVTFSRAVTGFTDGDVSVAGGAISNFAGSGDAYSFTVTPSISSGLMKVSLAAGIAAAADDMAVNNESNILQWNVDMTAPSATVNWPVTPTNADPLIVTVNFDEPVKGVHGGTLTVSGPGSPSVVKSAGQDGEADYEFRIEGTSDGNYNLSLSGSGIADIAGNPTNTILGSFTSITVDRSAPVIGLNTPPLSYFAGSNLNLSGPCEGSYPVTITFSGAEGGSTTTSCDLGNWALDHPSTLGAAGLVNVTISQKDDANNIGTSTAKINKREILVVEPAFSGSEGWFQFRQRANMTAPCGGSELGFDACVHTGADLKVTVNSRTSCDNLSMTDDLSAFKWKCIDSSPLVFKSAGFKPGKSLSDLLNRDSWKSNKVQLNDGSNTIGESMLGMQWWGNTTIQSLPASPPFDLNTSNTIYTVNATTSIGTINIMADKVGLVALNGAKIQSDQSSNACSSAPCMIYINNRHFVFIEADFEGRDSPLTGSSIIQIVSGSNIHIGNATFVKDKMGIHATDSKHMRVYNADFSTFGPGIKLGGFMAPDYSVIKNVRSMNSEDHGIVIDGRRFVKLQDIVTANNTMSGTLVNNSEEVTLIKVLSTSNGASGIKLQNSPRATILGATVAQNGAPGIYISNSTNVNIANLLTHTNSNVALKNESSAVTVVANAYMGGSSSVLLNSGTLNFAGKIYVPSIPTASCSNSGGGTGNFNPTGCAWTTGPTFQNGTYSGLDIEGPVSNTAFASIVNWFLADWFKVYGSSFPGRCMDGQTCTEYNWRLKPDTFISQLNGAFSPDSPCPASVDGDEFLQNTVPFLMSAYEMDGTGNRNGICESGETCMYMPQVGAHQGQGDGGLCSFSNGALNNIIMHVPATL